MTWLKFIYCLSGLYTCYYLANIGWDLLRSRKGAKSAGWVQELSFSEDIKPQQVTGESATQPKLPEKAKSPVIGSGGIPLKELFQKAKAEIIVYTGAVTY